ncbi:MAG: hypothetical protein EON60_08970 [Alphaproteobacteria bacterium]|nr:MAG: hypothetical protein EON60_08970 [Alphaproteobacteria bacterium]
MLKFATILFLGVLMLAAPSHAALSEVQGVYVKKMSFSTLTVCTRNDNLETCYKLVTRPTDTQGVCSPPVMRNLVAITKAEKFSDPIPKKGFTTVEALALNLKLGQVDAFSGEFFPCRSLSPVWFEGTFCADTILRDGIYEYDHCVITLGSVTTTPAPDAAAAVEVTRVTDTTLNVCEALSNNEKYCVQLEDEPLAMSMCENVPAAGWQPFDRFLAYMREATSGGQQVFMGTAPCRTGMLSVTTCVMHDTDSTQWQLCSPMRIIPLTEQ